MSEPSAPLRLLHIASFSGNIGDNANHMGFRPWVESQLGQPVTWTNLEIREFYWKEREWDEALVEFINAHDMLIIGGGNYFELWVENSPTGTSIAIEPELFEKINVPIFFNALGVDPGQGVPELSRERFAAFLETLLGTSQYLVSIRNDGARDNLRKHIGQSYADQVHVLPDHGFFVPRPVQENLWLQGNDSRLIAINLACDMSEIRFSDFENRAAFSAEMAMMITVLAEQAPDARFCFVPHIFKDIEVISEVIGFLDDRLRRTRVIVSPYGSGDFAARQALSLYASADLVLGMRFHSNVCPLGLGTNVLGLNCYAQIENLYGGLDLKDRLINVSNPGFANDGAVLAGKVLAQSQDYLKAAKEAVQRVKQKRSDFEPVLQDWLSRQ